MKYLINRLNPVLCTGLFLFIYYTVGTAQAIEVVDPVRAMAAQCAQCHGMEGNDSEGFEDLNGEAYNEIYEELVEMLDSSDNDLMVHQAKGYTEEQIEALAYYFSGQPKTSVSDGKSEEESVDEKDEKDEEDEEDEESHD